MANLQTIPATPEAIADYFMTCTLLELTIVQRLLGEKGIDLHVGTGELITVSEPQPFR